MSRGKAFISAFLCVAGLGFAAAPAGAEVVWLCKPGLADDPCAIGLDTTYEANGAPDQVVTPQTKRRRLDCFYVYPTVSNQLTPNANRSRDPELASIAKFQAARFSQRCRVFAPVYRQSTLASIATGYFSGNRGDRERGYRDVLEAWHVYLAEHNRGRGVVLIGHSQGTFVLRSLIAREIEDRPKQRRKIVSALLLGGNVEVAAGRRKGGDFDRMALCARPGQIRCVVAFSSFAEDPDSDARFGTTSQPGRQIACTDPRRLARWRGPMRLLTPSEPFAPGLIAAGVVVTAGGLPPSASTSWVSPPDRYQGACRVINGANVLRLEPEPGSRAPGWFPEPGWGTHLIDVNIALEPLVEIVRRQARTWAAR